MIHINSNDPEHMKARQNVKPLTMEEEKELIEILNLVIGEFPTLPAASNGRVIHTWDSRGDINRIIQRFIYRYENLKYFYHVIGGWEGLGKNLDAAAKISTGLLTNDDISEIQQEADEIISRGFSSSEDLERYRKEAYSEDEKTAAREAQIKNVSQAIDDVENYDKVHFTHEVNLQTGEEKIVDLGNWIDVKDRLPETNGVYIVVDKYNEIYGDAIYGFDKQWTLTDSFDGREKLISDVTHWQPLPEPPKTLKS